MQSLFRLKTESVERFQIFTVKIYDLLLNRTLLLPIIAPLLFKPNKQKQFNLTTQNFVSARFMSKIIHPILHILISAFQRNILYFP